MRVRLKTIHSLLKKKSPRQFNRGLEVYSSINAAWAAANLAIGTRNGEQET